VALAEDGENDCANEESFHGRIPVETFRD